jgi:hypothetical protein
LLRELNGEQTIEQVTTEITNLTQAL